MHVCVCVLPELMVQACVLERERGRGGAVFELDSGLLCQSPTIPCTSADSSSGGRGSRDGGDGSNSRLISMRKEHQLG